MKTVIEQLIEELKTIKENECKQLYEVHFFDGVLAIIDAGKYLEKEKQQSIDNVNTPERLKAYLLLKELGDMIHHANMFGNDHMDRKEQKELYDQITNLL